MADFTIEPPAPAAFKVEPPPVKAAEPQFRVEPPAQQFTVEPPGEKPNFMVRHGIATPDSPIGKATGVGDYLGTKARQIGEAVRSIPGNVANVFERGAAYREKFGPGGTASKEERRSEAFDVGSGFALGPGVGSVGRAGMGSARAAAAAPAKAVAGTIEKIFSPTTVGPEAAKAEGLIRQEIGKAERDTQQARAAMDGYAAQINAKTPAEQLDFIGYVEGRSRGAALADPALQPVADTLKKIYDQRRAKLEALPSTAKMTFVEDYYNHLWKDTKAAESCGRAPMQGSGRNVKQRTIPTIADGIAAGLEPVTTNPLETTLAYVTNMDRFIAHNQIVDTARASRSIKYFQPGNQPEGWAELKGRLAEKARPVGKGGAPGASIIKAYAPADFARVYNNFIGRGFHEFETGGKVYDALRKAANSITMSELGFSGFHAYTMAQEAMVSGFARALGKGARGEVVPGIKAAARGVTPWEVKANLSTGLKVEQQYLGLKDHGPDFRRVVDLGTRANMRAVSARDARYRGSAMGSYWDAWKRGSLKTEMKAGLADMKARPVVGTATQFARLWARSMDTVAQPLFDKMIPRLKNGSFYEELHDWIGAHPAATEAEQVAAARQIWDSVDNRFGELVLDNLFWNKMLKQSLQLMVRAVGWDLGTLREIGGGVADAARGAKGGRAALKDLSPRTKYVLALPVVAAMGNAVWNYLRTGKAPSDLWTYDTGGVNPDGTPEKAMVPGYMKDVLGYIHDPVSEAAGKIGTGPKLVWELLTNKDYRGLPIAETSEWAKANEALPWWAAYAQHVGEAFVPITAKSLKVKEGSAIGVPERLTGIRPAPKYIAEPEEYAQQDEHSRMLADKRKRRSDQRLEGQYGQ